MGYRISKKVIGNISIVAMDHECFSCYLGWQIDVPYWNQEIMTEAAKAVVDYLFGIVGFDRITSGMIQEILAQVL